MIKEILTRTDTTLLLPSLEIDFNNPNPKLEEIITDMYDTANANKMFGISACQIGVNSCIILVLNHKNNKYDLYINPKIITHGSGKKVSLEESYSAPGLVTSVKRYKEITVEGYDIGFNRVVVKAKGIYSYILQHQIDHLYGILMIHRGETKLIPKSTEA